MVKFSGETPYNPMSEEGGNTSPEKVCLIAEATEVDWQDYKNIILEAFRLEPEAFGPTQLADAETKTDTDWQQELLNKNRHIFFAKQEGVVAGVAGVRPSKQNEKEWIVFSVYVRASARGNKFSELLLSNIETCVAKNGGQKLILYVSTHKKQEAAYTLYTKIGFKEMDEEGLVNYIYMEKELSK